jgi:hypothetical protein
VVDRTAEVVPDDNLHHLVDRTARMLGTELG